MNQDAISVASIVKALWIGIGVLLISNFGVFFKVWWDSRSKQVQKEEDAKNSIVRALDQNTEAIRDFDLHLQRLFTAVKILAGDKWPDISEIIRSEHPRS